MFLGQDGEELLSMRATDWRNALRGTKPGREVLLKDERNRPCAMVVQLDVGNHVLVNTARLLHTLREVVLP